MAAPYQIAIPGLVFIEDDYENVHGVFPSSARYLTFSGTAKNRGDRKTPTPFSYWWGKYTTAQGIIETVHVRKPSDIIGSRSGHVGPTWQNHLDPYPDLSAADSLAIKRIFTSVSGENRILAGVSLAELRETATTGTAILQATAALHRGIKQSSLSRSKRSTNNAIANAWLTWAVGVRPLISDINSYLRALRDSKHAREYHYRVHASGTNRKRNKVQDFRGHGLPTVTSTKSRVSVRYAIDVSVKNPLLDYAHRMGLINPLTTVWEAARLSFLVDYFTGIGDYIGQTEDLLYASVNWDVSGQKTVIRHYYTTCQGGGRGAGSNDYNRGRFYGSTAESLSFERSRITALPMSSPKKPELDFDLRAGQWATTAALFQTCLVASPGNVARDAVRRAWPR